MSAKKPSQYGEISPVVRLISEDGIQKRRVAMTTPYSYTPPQPPEAPANVVEHNPIDLSDDCIDGKNCKQL